MYQIQIEKPTGKMAEYPIPDPKFRLDNEKIIYSFRIKKIRLEALKVLKIRLKSLKSKTC